MRTWLSTLAWPTSNLNQVILQIQTIFFFLVRSFACYQDRFFELWYSVIISYPWSISVNRVRRVQFLSPEFYFKLGLMLQGQFIGAVRFEKKTLNILFNVELSVWNER